MGDVLSMIEKAQEAFDAEQAQEIARKFKQDTFTLEDFLNQLQQVKKLGSFEQILGMLPGMGMLKDLKKAQVDQKEFVRMEAIINSMTREERRNVRYTERKPQAKDCRRKRDERSGCEPASQKL